MTLGARRQAHSHPTRRSVARVALLASVLGGLGACAGSDPAQLRLLEEDPLATWKPPGQRLLDETTYDAKSGGLMGKPQHAEINRVYAVDGSVEEAVAAWRATAKQSGWEPGATTGSSGFTATKSQGDHSAVLNVASGPQEGQLNVNFKI